MILAGPELKLTMNPYQVKQEHTDRLGATPKSISPKGRDRFTGEINNLEQSEKMAKTVAIGDWQCSVKEYPFYNFVKGLVYIRNSNIEIEEAFEEGLRMEYYVTKVERASWVISRDKDTKAFVLTYNHCRNT